MGLHDTIRLAPAHLAPPAAQRVPIACPDGHPLHELQTKGLGKALRLYLLGLSDEPGLGERPAKLYGPGPELDAPPREDWVLGTPRWEARYVPFESAVPRSGIHAVRTVFFPPSDLTKVLTVYTECRTCLPIQTRTDGFPEDHHVYVQQSWSFVKGLLVRVVPVAPQSRDDLRKELLARHMILVDDT